MEVKLADLSKKIEFEEQNQKQIVSGFKQLLRLYFELKNKEKDKLTENLEEELFVNQKEVDRFGLIDATLEASQKIEEESHTAFNMDSINSGESSCEIFLTKQFEETINYVNKSKEIYLSTAKFDPRKLIKKKQQVYETCFKMELDSRGKNFQLIASEVPIDREIQNVKEIIDMKQKQLKMLKGQMDGKHVRKAILQKRKEILQERVETASAELKSLETHGKANLMQTLCRFR